MDLEKTFTYIWEDADWLKKIAIAAVLLLTGIGAIAVTGWAAEIARRVANDEPEPLPGWEEIGQFFVTGLKYMAILFIWSLPAIIIVTIMSAAAMFAFQVEDSGTLGSILAIGNVCIIGLIILYSLAIGVLSFPLWVRVAGDDSFGELLKPTGTWKLLRANLGGYLITMLVVWLLSMVAGAVGSVLCGVGVFFTSALVQAFLGHMIGQATAQAKINMDLLPAVE